MNNEFLYNPNGYIGHSHSSTIVEHKNELYMSWYVYEDKENDKGQIVYTKYDKKEGKWERSNFAFPGLKGTSQGNPVLFSFNDTLNIFFVILKRHYWDSSEIYSSTFNNESSVWSTPQKVNTKEGVMIRHRPMIINNQAIIPAYDESTMTTILYNFSNPISIWSEHHKFSEKCIQGDIIAFNNQECQMYLRSSDDLRKVLKTSSHNSGKQWDMTRSTRLHCPLSGIAAILLSSGKILVANNHTEKHKRNPISLSVSETRGLDFDLGTWHVDISDIELSYPSLFQESSGIIHLSFTYNRKMIKHISFTEDELLKQLSKNES